MAENTILVCFLALCAGQLLAWRKGAVSAVTYYICVGPLEYFSVWQFATLDLTRGCGVLLVAGGLFSTEGRRLFAGLGQHRFVFFVVYGVVVTLVGAVSWPVGAVSHSSVMYTQLRIVVQICNWILVTLCAWLIAAAFRDGKDLSAAIRTICRVGFWLSIYGIYQFVADQYGLPMSGIRRPWVGITAGNEGEQMAAYLLGADRYYRPNSLMCEPKDFASYCVFWLVLLLARAGSGSGSYVQAVECVVISLGLYLSAATSAWAAMLGIGAQTVWVAVRNPLLGSRWTRRLVLPMAIPLACAVMVVGVRWNSIMEHVGMVVEERWTSRMENFLGDLPEEKAKDILCEKPHFALCGVGMGGISFYIAEALGGSELILYPNNGLLAWICNFGIAGVVLWYLTFRRGIELAGRLGRKDSDSNVGELAFVGLGMAIQSLAYSKLTLLSVSMGWLLAAELCCNRNRSNVFGRTLTLRGHGRAVSRGGRVVKMGG